MKLSVWTKAAVVIGGVAIIATAFGAVADQKTKSEYDRRTSDPRNAKYTVGEKKSGYVYMTAVTRDMQDDDFSNPSFLWVDIGKAAWDKVEGKAGKSCASCHKSADSMKGVVTRYPVYDKKTKKMMALEHKINLERKKMGAKPWKWESDDMLGMTAFIGLQSRGMPMNVSTDGPAKKFYEKGKAFYNERRGLLDLACAHCHNENAGKMIRSNLLSQGQANGFPTFRLKWQKVGSIHRRFKGCNDQVRAQPYKRGSEEYTNLELFVKSRGNGLPVETPAVRN